LDEWNLMKPNHFNNCYKLLNIKRWLSQELKKNNIWLLADRNNFKNLIGLHTLILGNSYLGIPNVNYDYHNIDAIFEENTKLKVACWYKLSMSKWELYVFITRKIT